MNYSNLFLKIASGAPVILLILQLFVFQSCSNDKDEMIIVQNGEANAVIVLPDTATDLQQSATRDFVNILKKASGAGIQIISEAEISEVPDSFVKIVIGPDKLTAELLGENPELEPEEFYITSRDNYLIILAEDIPNESERYSSRVTSWAYGYLLDRYLGVRWLWPGELGTYVPGQETIHIPATDVRWQQPLVSRRFRIRNNTELVQWCTYHQSLGGRKIYNLSHSFVEGRDNGDWWKNYRNSHPDYFAKDPDGNVTLWNPERETFYKLDQSTPEVVTRIVSLWEEAGMPDFWCVAPNDSRGWCTCEDCMEFDRTYGVPGQTKMEVWKGQPDLSDRYVWFWNRIIGKMREKNPDARIGTYFYSAYTNPPRTQRLEPGIIGGFVPGLNYTDPAYDFSIWEGWEEKGASGIGLRPNWWHMGGNAPHLPLHDAGEFIKKARNAKMIFLDMDSMKEFWATQSPYYYLVGRMMARPDLTIDEIIAEYCSAFGDASGQIREYIDYWEDFQNRVNYNIPAVGDTVSESLYADVCRKYFGEILPPLNGHWKTLPFIYTDEVMSDAYDLLNNATRNASDSLALKRIDFLRDGLHQLEIIIDAVVADESEREDRLSELQAFSEDMEEKYGYWGRNGISTMRYRKVFIDDMDALIKTGF